MKTTWKETILTAACTFAIGLCATIAFAWEAAL
jgi:hypothetical protein